MTVITSNVNRILLCVCVCVCVCDRIFYGEDIFGDTEFYLVIIALSNPDC
jgi:hypothetical protein